MRTVTEQDTLWMYWRVLEDTPEREPVDLTGATASMSFAPHKRAGETLELPAEVVGDPTEGRIRHKYDTVPPGVWLATALVDGPPGEGTAPTASREIVRVLPRL